MRHPLQAIPHEKRKIVFWGLFTATVIWMIVMQAVGAPLINPTAPVGIVTWELAGNADRAREIIASWDYRAQSFAALGLGLDYVFMLLYSTTVGLACIWAGENLHKRRWPLENFGVGLAWGQWAAAILDGLENIGLILVLLGSAAAPWPELARFCALGKFALLFAGLGYAFYGLAARLIGQTAHEG